MKELNRSIWKELFGYTISQVTSIYNISDSEFASETGCSSSTLRRWKEGNRIPNDENFSRFVNLLRKRDDVLSTDIEYFFTVVSAKFMACNYKPLYLYINSNNTKNVESIIRILKFCADAGKGKIIVPSIRELEKIESTVKYPSKNKIMAVVFDFDGTLTKSEDLIVKTTWENIWTSLGYHVKECQNLHKRFDRKEIDHPEWCRLTEIKFKERGLKKNILYEIAEKIKLIEGVEKTFSALRDKDIKIFIVSGSIKLIIQTVLGSLNEYVDSIRANVFDFDDKNYLTRIVGTKYDFEGKAEYIRIIADDLQISPKDILFVGNSRNDQFVHKSGARTLCINPSLTDMTNTTIWDDYIETCENLTEILNYIK